MGMFGRRLPVTPYRQPQVWDEQPALRAPTITDMLGTPRGRGPRYTAVSQIDDAPLALQSKPMDAPSAAFDFNSQPMAQQKVAPQGMFGRMGQMFQGMNSDGKVLGLRPGTWQAIAAGAHDLSRGENTMPDIMERVRQQREADKQKEARQAAIDAYNANPNDPLAAQRAMMTALQGGDPDAAIGLAGNDLTRRIGRADKREDQQYERQATIEDAPLMAQLQRGYTRGEDGTYSAQGFAKDALENDRTQLRIAAATAARAGDNRGEIVDARMFQQGQGLADDFRQQTKGYSDIADTGRYASQYRRVLAAGQRDPSMEGALLMKIAGGLQSGVLSDSDIRTASGGTLPTNVLSLVDNATGKGRLSAAQVQGLLRVADMQATRARERVQGYVDNVRGIAQARGIPSQYVFGVDPMTTMFGEDTQAPPDDTPDLLKRLEELERQRVGGGFGRQAARGQPGGYTGR